MLARVTAGMASRSGASRAALAPIQLPFDAQPVEMADASLKRCRTLGDLVAQHPTGALRVLVESLPHEGHLNDTELSASLKRWTCTLSEGRLAQGDGHDCILLDIDFRMQSAHSS